MIKSYKTAVAIGILAGYAVLGIILFAFHETPGEVFWDLAPFFAVGVSGFALVSLSPERPTSDQVEQRSLWRGIFGCYQNFAWPAMIGFVCAGFFFGALLSRVVKLLF